MGVDSRRPPLPAPTESMDENDTSGGDTEVATNVTTRTDKTHYTIPEDGRPITISTQKITSGSREGGIGKHGRQKSQTSLLIEYFEASKTGDKSRSRPSVRVKVTPSSARKGRSGADSVQITSIGGDRKASYTRRIALPGNSSIDTGLTQRDSTELSGSSGSIVSGYHPLEIEVLDPSEVSKPNKSSRGLTYAPVESNVSSMPPDSMLEGENSLMESELSNDDTTPAKETAYLRAPQRTGSQNRTNSRDRITQRVMEKLGASATKPRKSSRSSQERNSKENEHTGQTRERRRRSSKSQHSEDDAVTGAESSLLSNKSERSYRSGTSQARSMTNNPKLLEMVEDTIKRMILPELNQMKEEQKIDRKLHKYDDSSRGSIPDSSAGLERKVSKSSSTPHLPSKPKVVLNRDGDNPGVVLSRGDSERVKHRRASREHVERPSSSRRSSGRHSREGSYEGEERLHKKSSRSTNGLRGAAAAGLAGGVLTSAALKHHDSQGDLTERRKKRTKSRSSRSRSASINDSIDEGFLQTTKVPAMPMASAINDSDMTRESILSQATDRPPSRASADMRTPIREVSRGSIGGTISPASSRTPTRPASRQDKNLGMSQTNVPLHSSTLDSPVLESPGSLRSPNGGMSNKERLAALAAAGLRSAAAVKGYDSRHVDADGYGAVAPRRKISNGSPVQSVSSLRNKFEDDPLIPQGLRPRSAASRSSAGRLRESQHSRSSLRSESSPTTQRLAQSAKQSRDVSVDELETPAERPDASFWREGTGTPGAETADEWLERQHLINDQYRDSMATNRDSYQTNPYPEDSKRFTMYTDDSYLDRHSDAGEDGEQGVRDISSGGLAPNYVHTPVAVESAVASLMEPSTVSSHGVSSLASPRNSKGTYSDRMALQLNELGKDNKAALYNGSTLSESIPSQDRWAAIKGHARNLSEQSPAQSPVQDLHDDEKPVMTASGLPLTEDPLPEIGHYDSQSDLHTNPSIIHGPLGGDVTGKSTWPYTPEPESNRNSTDQRNGLGKGAALTAAAAGGAAALAATHAAREAKVEDLDIDREATPTGRSFRDEGYATDGRTRSAGGLTPKAELYGKQDLDEYHRAMDAQDLGHDDPFSPTSADPRHLRQVSGNSHGMESPLYDASTGRGMDRIESKDIVALMDHLTVRDAQRNARDTEILVTLVRSAAEMRSSFDEMKKFIAEQDKLIMQNTDRDAELTAQKVLGGPRPQPSPRTPRRQLNSEEDIQTKRKGVLSRALKGLTGGKSAKDLARVEDMLMQILDNVEDLKYQQSHNVSLDRSYTMDSLDTYENMRATQDSGYEQEGAAGTSTTPSPSGHLPTTPREKQQFHSGYDGRRGSDTRVSTVLEESDDELEPHEAHVLNHQFENNERMLTPTQERQRNLGLSPKDTPPQATAAANDYTPDKHRKHKSNSSSLFGVSVPKISRWSRTTASSAAPDPATLDSPKQTRTTKKSFDSSRSSLDDYDDVDEYSLRSKVTVPRKQEHAGHHAESRSMRSQASSRLTRTPSPLIPSETSAKQRASHEYENAGSPIQEDDEALFDDPKYQAHRNSLLLQHPQPRQGTTSRHQNTLETQAQSYDDPAGTNSDLSQQTVSDFDPSAWGSSGTAGLARHRLTQVEPLSPVSMASHDKYGNRRGSGDSDPLVPQQKPAVPPNISYDDPEEWEEPQYSNSGFSKGGYYSSPYGSGHLLEPIEEVRYSLETDSGRHQMSPEPQVASAKAVNISSPARKGGLTGPRPMASSQTPSNGKSVMVDSAGSGNATGTVRRKPVPGALSGQGSKDSLDSETF